MLPLALILKARGYCVEGSDRSLDQGRTASKFDFLRAKGITLWPQDGIGITSANQVLIASAAIENTVPDIAAAMAVGATRITRADMLAHLFNAAPCGIGVAGTSGKSTTTGMIGWILHNTGHNPTVMNGAVMKNFVSAQAPFASAVVGDENIFVSEVDESDGSIAMFKPDVAVLNNISLDHKSLEELRTLFNDFITKSKTAVLNLDNAETAAIAANLIKALTYSLKDQGADFLATDITPMQNGISFIVKDKKSNQPETIKLKMPGRHNVANALAAIAAVCALGVSLSEAATALEDFSGIKRRLEMVGEANGITIIDDFAHNPDKIAATLSSLHDFPGRLLILFQPHGFGPLKLMRESFVETFSTHLLPDDILVMSDPVYYGGTVDRAVSSNAITEAVTSRGRSAFYFSDRKKCGSFLTNQAQAGDRIIVMGARDDTLSQLATELLKALEKRLS